MNCNFQNKLPKFEPFEPQIQIPNGYRRVPNSFMTALGASENEAIALESIEGLWVIITGQKEMDGNRWLHASISRKNQKMPSYNDMCRVKHDLLGADSLAYQVFPPQKEHVNIHATCLHLWCPLDHRPTPDFTWGLGSI